MRFANNAREIAVKRVFQIVLVYNNFRDDFVDVLIKNPFSSIPPKGTKRCAWRA